MPEISRFYGIVIKMFFLQREHNPPHIYALYGDCLGEFDIKTGNVLVGDLPAKAVKLVQEWIALHQEELSRIWNTQQFQKLPPLE
ncbi:MAG: DUF4160 domain-containing protein [Oscillospiraceae bacterium]|jgi:hypothetical protein|nr:DUF4160 domain-containing protein [Oscillospiraceae bacterium]